MPKLIKLILLFIGIYLLGVIITTIVAMVLGASEPAEFSYYSMIIYSIYYLASIMGVCTYLIIKTIKKEGY
ncbi:hypothetical protein [Sporosalibacterium faouarense]|uniref:hypothetical protein n=1 Tax=Sporosalibacterium faouarense TaxID=516123 RepID=UPI00192C1250|nr:hypothetical protein [Sporosalibacterium faouarense]